MAIVGQSGKRSLRLFNLEIFKFMDIKGMGKNSAWCHNDRFSIYILHFVIAYQVATPNGSLTKVTVNYK